MRSICRGRMMRGPVVGFGPQHQSTCGLKFKRGSGGGGRHLGLSFGRTTRWWWGNRAGSFGGCHCRRCGRGYVGRAVPIAAIGMLTIDLAVFAQWGCGDLLPQRAAGLGDGA